MFSVIYALCVFNGTKSVRKEVERDNEIKGEIKVDREMGKAVQPRN